MLIVFLEKEKVDEIGPKNIQEILTGYHKLQGDNLRLVFI